MNNASKQVLRRRLMALTLSTPIIQGKAEVDPVDEA
jgi:hypothetical protein